MNDQLSVARLQVARERPYYAAILWAFQPVPTKDFAAKALGPIGVDAGLRLYYDPEAIAQYKPDELAGILVHEIGHVIRAHSKRVQGRDDLVISSTGAIGSLWNIAADCVAPGTAITLADGTTKPVERIQPGDAILGVQRGLLVRGYVRAVIARPRDGIGVELSAGRSTLRSTLDHRVLTEAGYVRVHEAIGRASRTAQVFRVRDGVHPRAAHDQHDRRDGRDLGAAFSKRPVDHEIARSAGIAGDVQAPQLAGDAQSAVRGAWLHRRDGGRGWDRDGGPQVQHEAERDVLSAAHYGPQYERLAAGLDGRTRVLVPSLHEYQRDTVLEDERGRQYDRDRVGPAAALAGRQGPTGSARDGVLYATGHAGSQREANPEDAPNLSGTEALELAGCEARRVVIPSGTVYYDLVTTCHSFIADGFAVHNCEINDDLRDEKVNIGANAVYPDTTFKLPVGLMAEEYYELLQQQMKDKPKVQMNCGSGRCGSIADSKSGDHEQPSDGNDRVPAGVSGAEQELLRQKVAEDVASHAKTRGTVPAWLERWAKERLKSKVDWRRLLAAMIRHATGHAKGATDFTYSRPGRRSGALKDFVWPSLQQPVPRISIVVDTSGSMSEKELAQALAEIEGVLTASGQRQGVTVMAVDAAIHTTQKVFKARDVKLMGGGGTDMTLGLLAAERARPKPHVIILVTDGCTPYPERSLSVPVIVALTGRSAEGAVPSWAKKVVVEPDTKDDD